MKGIVDKEGTATVQDVCQEGKRVTLLSDDCEMIDDDFTVRDLTIADESTTDDNNNPLYLFTLILQE